LPSLELKIYFPGEFQAEKKRQNQGGGGGETFKNGKALKSERRSCGGGYKTGKIVVVCKNFLGTKKKDWGQNRKKKDLGNLGGAPSSELGVRSEGGRRAKGVNPLREIVK